MIKNDYLTAKIQELNEVVEKVKKLAEENKMEESHQLVNEALKRLVGLSPDIAESLAYRDIIKFIGAYESADSVKLMILGNLLKLLGDIYKAEDNFSKSFNLYLKSLNIYAESLSLDTETCLVQCRDNIESVIEIVREYDLPDDCQYSIFQCFEASGKFDKAEDMLYELIENPNCEINMYQKGINFYERLLTKSESELEEGNLPLDEVKYGLEHIRKLYNE